MDSTRRLLWAPFTWCNKTTWWLMIFPHKGNIHPNETTIGEVNGPLTWKARVGRQLLRKLKGLRKDNGRSTASTASLPAGLAEPCRFSATREWKDGRALLFYLQNINSQHTRCFALVLGKEPISEMLLAIDLLCFHFVPVNSSAMSRFGVLEEGETRSAPHRSHSGH